MKTKFGTTNKTQRRIRELHKDYDAEDIAEFLGMDLAEVRGHLPKGPLRWRLIDRKTGREWPAHSPRKAYMLAQLKGLTDYGWERAA